MPGEPETPGEHSQAGPPREQDAVIRSLLERCPFHARWPWIQGDLQTLRNFLPGRWAGLAPEQGVPVEIPLRDGSGDRLVARFHPAREPGPTVVLVPGLTGCEASPAVLQAAGHLLEQGLSVLRLNLRGAPMVAGIAQGLHHMGRISDLADACVALAGRRAVGAEYGVFVIGFSLGGSLALRLAASSLLPDNVRAIVSVSAPMDLAHAADHLSRARNRVYERWLLTRMLAQSEFIWRDASPSVRTALRRARHVRDFDDALTSGIAGYGDAREYYSASSPLREVGSIRIPALIVHADDDPWIPPPGIASRPPLHVAVSRGGGHVGFHGRGSRIPWHLRIGRAFLQDAAPWRSTASERENRLGASSSMDRAE